MKQEIQPSQPINITERLRYQSVWDEFLLKKVDLFMSPEFRSNGGLLRDTSLEELHQLINRGGKVWIAQENNNIYACFTISALQNSTNTWHYINHGVTHKKHRHNGSGIQNRLLETSINHYPSESKFIVITIAQTIFQNLGFREINLSVLEGIDPLLTEIIELKLQSSPELPPGIAKHIYIKTPGII